MSKLAHGAIKQSTSTTAHVHTGKGAMDTKAVKAQQSTAAHASLRSGGKVKVGAGHPTVGTHSGAHIAKQPGSRLVAKPPIRVPVGPQPIGGHTTPIRIGSHPRSRAK